MSNLAETLYYQTFNSTILGNMDDAKMYLSFLREEYEENEVAFDVLKKDRRWKHLIDIGNAIDKGQVLSKNILNEEKVLGVLRQEKETIYSKQDDLVRAIILCQDSLRTCVYAEADFHCNYVEMETKFGRVDLVAQDKKTVYPIEVKKNGAYHDVIGQINKYIMHFKLKLINRTYNDVIGIVIANSFETHIIKELYNVGAIPIKYKFKSEKNVEFCKL